jgi:hypothetical protein
VAGVAVVWCYGGGHPSYLVLSWFPFPFRTREEEKRLKSARDASDTSRTLVVVVVVESVVMVDRDWWLPLSFKLLLTCCHVM